MKNKGARRACFFCLLIALSLLLSGCVLDRRVLLQSGSYIPLENMGTAGPVSLLVVDRDGQQVVFSLADGSRTEVSFVARDQSNWPSGCPTNTNSTYMDVLDINVGTLTLGGLTFKNPILVRDCPADPERIALRENGPVGGGGGACVGADSCLLFERRLEATPVPTAGAVTAEPPRLTGESQPAEELTAGVKLEAELQVPNNEVSVTIPGSVGGDSHSDVDKAQETLLRFFSLLNQGHYAEVVDLYGGPYDVLQAWNPTADAQDYAELLERGCMANGLQCLPVKQILAVENGSRDRFIFTVTFENPDGSLFVLNPEGAIPRSEFDYTVVRSEEDYIVEELPVYVP